MSNYYVVSSPGKVILSGEYAVLDNAPAICMAIDCRAEAKIQKCNSEISRVKSIGFSSEDGEFMSSKNGISWCKGKEFKVINAVWQVINFKRLIGLKINLDTSSFIDVLSDRKLGLGSSAAIIVALIAAMKNCDNPEKIKLLTHKAHKQLQGGLGSGADVATSLHGGLIKFQTENYTTKSLSWPNDLFYRLIWTGSSASTKDKLIRFMKGQDKLSRKELTNGAISMATHWGSGDAKKILAGYENYCELLYKFSCDYDLGIFSMGHKELLSHAKKNKLVYKPCGAGGGDVGILLGLDEKNLDKFCSSMRNDFKKLDYKLSSNGVRIES